MPLTRDTREAIRAYLLGRVRAYINRSLTNTRTEKPFHSRLMPGIFETRFSERSFSTSTGSWFQRIAQLVASQYHQRAVTGHLVTGRIAAAAEAHIQAIVEEMDHGRPRRVPNREQDLAEVHPIQTRGGIDREVRSDLFVLRHDNSELYFEMKTPGPNKGQCKAMKRDILLITALRHGQPAEAYAAAAYNPFGEGRPYTAQYVDQFLEIGADFLVGGQFWSIIGDASTYGELLDIAIDVGREIRPLIE